jgi:hypothetical protein
MMIGAFSSSLGTRDSADCGLVFVLGIDELLVDWLTSRTLSGLEHEVKSECGTKVLYIGVALAWAKEKLPGGSLSLTPVLGWIRLGRRCS